MRMSGAWPWWLEISGKRFWICEAEEVSTWWEEIRGAASLGEGEDCRVDIRSSTLALLVEYVSARWTPWA
jgi:hypothetical protein